REGYRRGGIPKVAVMAHTLEDVQRLLCAASEEKYEKILISMGEVGRVSRVCAYVFGSVITYASFKTSLAPGQLPLEEMVRLRELIFT
ncbi:MAG TPA: type I 3-dehydroquinate dehydratase, partial [Aquificaceae bacterium]|nr:type I 3-dehydroquinate dehydratase [Aquificaceae bacterium]